MSTLVLAYTAREQRELIGGIVSIALGVLIFMFPRLLNTSSPRTSCSRGSS